jgi:hypothetical protein
MRNKAPALLPIFRSRLQGELLSWLFFRPEEEFTLTQLANKLDASPGSMHGEVDRLVDAAILVDRRVGRSRLIRANTSARVAGPLTELLLITFGPEWVVSQEFDGLVGARKVLIYGSWARRYKGEIGREPADIDVMVVGKPDRDAVYRAAERSESRLKLPVNPTVRSVDAWRQGADPLVLTARNDALVIIDNEELEE